MTTATIIPEVEKEIKYNRVTKDYDCTVIIDGQREYIGSADSYGEGETKCRDYAFSYYEDNHTPEKAIAVVLADEQADRDASDEETPIGTIHGCEVYGSYYNEPGEPCHGQLYGGELEWNDRTIAFRVDSNRINIDPIEHAELAGDVHLDDWQWMRALAQTDVVEQLTALVRGDQHELTALLPAAIEHARREMADPAHRRRPPVEIDRTVNGISIMGEFDVDGLPYTVEIETDHWSLTADPAGCLALSCNEDGALIELDANEGGIAVLRDVAHLVNGDTLDRLLARARQWRELGPPEPDDEPPTPPTPAAPTAAPVHTIDLTSFPARLGVLSARLMFALRDEIGQAQAEPIMTWLESLSDGELAAQLVQMHAAAPIASIDSSQVRVKHIQDEGNRWTDFEIGDGLTEVVVMPRGWEGATGVYLIIGKRTINDYLSEVIELADLRQLRDNLTTLLADERLIGALAEQVTKPALKAA